MYNKCKEIIAELIYLRASNPEVPMASILDLQEKCHLKKLDMLKDQHVLLRGRKMSNVLWKAGQGALEISAAEESV